MQPEHWATTFTPEFCEAYSVFPVAGPDGELMVYTSPESDTSILDFVRYRAGKPVRVEQIESRLLAEMIRQDRKSAPQGPRHSSESKNSENGDSEVVRIIDALIRECIQAGASDIHIEPGEKSLVCRARIDGVLMERRALPRGMSAEILSRVKIMSRLDIAEKRRPQDGRIRFQYEGRMVDIRVSVIPTDFGEKVVLRLLDKETLRLDLKTLGMPAAQTEVFVRHIESPNGIILVTGPTGSGKTTTLYAALNHLNSSEINVSTVEDPIEYNLAGINQTQVRPEIGLGFAAMLRALLRQDPDVIMVGEIRDTETLEIAMRSSMTGHLVLSTIHTNSAAATISRLLDMGAEPFLLASSLRLIVAQRLLRRVCEDCVQTGLVQPEIDAAKAIGMEQGDPSGPGRGCSQCGGTGFRGRIAVYEMIEIDDPIREAMLKRAPESEILGIARGAGFRSLQDAAIDLARQGATTPSEVLREVVV